MAARGKRSLKASVDGIKRAEAALVHLAQSKTFLADKLGISRASIQNFFARKAVGYNNFIKICEELGLSWQKIAELPKAEIKELKSDGSTFNSQDCPANPDPNFVGREEVIADLNSFVSQGKKAILIQAEGGMGKTTLAKRYLYSQGFDKVIPFEMAKERLDITPVEYVVQEWLKRYFDEEPGPDFYISLDRLKHKLRDTTKKIGILIDNLEPALENGRFIPNHHRYAELLRALSDPTVQSVTLITSREPVYEDGISISIWPYQLKELSKEAWNQYFESYSINTGSSPLSEASALCQMHRAYGGNAEAMSILSSDIQRERKGNLEVYWEENKEDLLLNPSLENLVKSQFNKLQQDNERAYRLLCRLGCYRYQDVPSVPKEGILALLWDVPKERRERVVKALRDRSLVKLSHEGGYYLHPVSRAEAIARLRASEDWETANRKAAEFWKESVTTIETVEDLRKAFEAFPHYVDIEDFEQAASVIAQERSNKWEYRETLVSLFYRLGLSEKIHTIYSFINKIPQTSFLARVRIYEGLGDFYWLTGCTTKSLESYEISRNIAQEEKFKNNELHEFLALLNIGLVKLGLWEIEEAEKYFAALELMFLQRNASDAQLIWCRFCLAYAQACLGFKNKSSGLAEEIYNEILTEQWNSYKVCDLWITGYSFLFIGLTYKILGDNQKSFEMYTKAIEFAEESHYTMVKAKALDGFAQLYREEGNFKKALSYHSEAIELLDKSGEKCDIAEAYYQLGLTYQKIGDTQNNQENFDKAIQLFKEMEAPKQVEKVEQARDTGG